MAPYCVLSQMGRARFRAISFKNGGFDLCLVASPHSGPNSVGNFAAPMGFISRTMGVRRENPPQSLDTAARGRNIGGIHSRNG